MLVAHGMGQQQPFETMVALAEGLAREERIDGSARAAPVPRARRVQLGTEQLARLELKLGAGQQEVHVYEAYWAPLTEGRVRLRDVINFLVSAGANGLRNARRGVFVRWVFGDLQRYPIPGRNLLQLLIALLVIVALASMNIIIMLVALSRLIGVSSATAWPSAELLAELSGVFHLELAIGAAFGLTMLLACLSDATLLHRLTRALFWCLLAATVAAAGSCLTLIGLDALSADPPKLQSLRAVLRCFGATDRRLHWITWPALIAASLYVRRMIIQYMGDVAAYLSSHKLDRFEEVRHAIRTRVQNAAQAVYAALDADGLPLYESVALVGHSLGSVVAYDCLNRLLNDDELVEDKACKLDVHTRTSALVTFGSPLDKTAYVFGTRDNEEVMRGRAALAATSQPLIAAKYWRSIPWVNVHSPNDIVSGALELYDLPGAKGPEHVQNVLDTKARAFLLAHVQYWNTREVWKHLYGYLIAQK